MIKAQELRIGNLVFGKDLGPLNESIGRTKVQVINPIMMLNVSRYSPIPLTEKWFVKFGFEYIKEVGAFCFKDHLIYTIGKGVSEFNLFCSNDKDCIVKLKYVHQLQNLWYALTQEELKKK